MKALRQVVVRFVAAQNGEPSIAERITPAGTESIGDEIRIVWTAIEAARGFFVTIPVTVAGVNGHALRWITPSAVLDIQTRILFNGVYVDEFDQCGSPIPLKRR